MSNIGLTTAISIQLLNQTISIHLPLNILFPRSTRSQARNDHTSPKHFMFSHTTPTHTFPKLG